MTVVGDDGGGGDFSDDEGDAGMFWGDDGDNDYDENLPQEGAVGEGDGVEGEEPRRSSVGDRSFHPFEDTDHEALARRVEKALDDSLSQNQGSYESICKQHINNFMLGAETYARETQLSKRVTEWTRRLEPLLRAQEDAPEYDIHTYSDMVLSQVGAVVKMDPMRRFSLLGINGSSHDVDEEEYRRISHRRMSVQEDSGLVDFSEVVGLGGTGAETSGASPSAPSSAEVCRIFLACLMLANMGSLDVVPSTSLLSSRTSSVPIPRNSLKNSAKSDGMNNDVQNNQRMSYSKEMTSFGVRLLCSSRRHDVEKFRAPSVMK